MTYTNSTTYLTTYYPPITIRMSLWMTFINKFSENYALARPIPWPLHLPLPQFESYFNSHPNPSFPKSSSYHLPLYSPSLLNLSPNYCATSMHTTFRGWPIYTFDSVALWNMWLEYGFQYQTALKTFKHKRRPWTFTCSSFFYCLVTSSLLSAEPLSPFYIIGVSCSYLQVINYTSTPLLSFAEKLTRRCDLFWLW